MQMIRAIQNRFSAKLVLLIALVFVIPVTTALVTIKLTSTHSLKRFDQVLSEPGSDRSGFIREIFPQTATGDVAHPESILKFLRDYEHRRTFGLFMSLMVISVALAGVVVLLSMLIMKRGMLSLHELSLAAGRVGEGDFKIDLKPRSHDEFAELVRAFKTMAERLQETTVSRDFYNHAIESMPAAVFTLDEAGQVTTWNRQAEKLTGLASRETVGRPIDEFEAVVGRPAKESEIPFFGRESVVRSRDGLRRVVSRGVDYLYGREGKPSGKIETFVDISEQKEMERELVVAKERAEESSRIRSEFLANMSHEIRTPLNGILGLAEMLAEEEENPERRDNLRAIRQCGQNLLHLINEILDLSKLEAGRMILHPAIVATADVLREATATVEAACQKKGIALATNVAEGVPQTIEVDNHKLVQVLVNLLGNAAKFTDSGRISLTVSPWKGNRRGDILFEVADTGPGIPRERHQRIFESFVQGDSHLSKTNEGTGLGLAIARKLVDLMGGELWLESVEGDGSTFSFTIEHGPMPDEDRR